MINSNSSVNHYYNISELYIDEVNANSSSSSDVAEQWAAASADGVISKEELEQYPELAEHIVDTLGYGSLEAFLIAHQQTGIGNYRGEVTLSDDSIDAIDASISGSVDSGDKYTESANNPLPTNVDPNSTFVVFTLLDGSTITFDGPGAGEVANEFAKIYNNSPTFRQTMMTLAGEQGGQYSFHSVPLPVDGNTYMLGFNLAGTEGALASSGVFIQSSDEVNVNIAAVIIHEVAHDLHPDDHDHDDEGLPDAGESHSREQSIYHATVVNELSENGINIDYDVDGDDYSHDVMIFDDDYDAFGDQRNGAVSTTDTVDDGNGNQVNAVEYYSSLYAEAKAHIANGDYDEAMAVMEKIPAEEQITLDFKNPQTSETTSITYNARELFLQDLMMASDNADRFNTGEDNTQDKSNLAGFFNYLIAEDSGGGWADSIDSAAAGIHFDLSEELPMYGSSGGSGGTDFAGFNRDSLTQFLRQRKLEALLDDKLPTSLKMPETSLGLDEASRDEISRHLEILAWDILISKQPGMRFPDE